MKKIGYPTLSKTILARIVFWIRRFTTDNYDFIVSPNEFTDSVFGEAFQVSKDVMLRSEYPRNADMYISSKMRNTIRRNLFRNSQEAIWLYLPTHRNEGKDDHSTRQGYLELLSFDRLVTSRKQQIVFKPHYYEQNFFAGAPEGESVYMLDSSIKYSLYEILGAVDGLITDYSSVAFDYGSISDQVIIFNFDEEEYRRKNRELIRVPSDVFPRCTNTASKVLDLMSFSDTGESQDIHTHENSIEVVVQAVLDSTTASSVK